MDEKPFVNKVVTDDGQEYDLYDNRFPELTKKDKGKLIRVNEYGNLILE